ncbi:hypothetical protein [Georgenia muralis]
MSTDSGQVDDRLYARGRDVVLSYLTGAAGAWEIDDDVLETLTPSGGHRRIRVCVTDGPRWEVPWADARPRHRREPDGWWAFVRLRADSHEIYLAAESEVRERLYVLVADAGSGEDARPGQDEGPDPAADEGGRIVLSDDDVRALAHRWGELDLTQ